MQQQILSLYRQFFGCEPTAVEPIAGSAGNRKYLRLYDAQVNSVIGVGCSDAKEMIAFCALDQCMLHQGIRVPKVLVRQGNCYLQEDLGKVSLYNLIEKCQKAGVWDEATKSVLHQVMRDLPYIQSHALTGFDRSLCVREQRFGVQNIRWDLNYFKYCFLKGTGVEIDEMKLQAEFDALENRLMAITNALPSVLPTFLYRDFQSRNIMVREGKPYYIDFQAGHEGPVYYDVVSFLWQTRANYPEALRRELLDIYFQELNRYMHLSAERFQTDLQQFVFFRQLQVLGAYGYRGIFEHKAAFLSPIWQTLLAIRQSGLEYAYIHQLLDAIVETPFGRALCAAQTTQAGAPLVVRICSFSYKKGIPADFSGNGGGFVFDCRAPHNPGRYAEYKHLTGLDQPVIDFLEGRDNNPEHKPFGTELTMPQFLEHVYALVDPAVETYLTRGFTNLMVSFGCTGGQHRSVYGAQHLAEHLKSLHPDLRIQLTHREQNIYMEL